MTVGLLLLWLGGYMAAGTFVALVFHALRGREGVDVNAEALTAVSLFWPLCIPDLLFRLCVGRWFGGRRVRREGREGR